MLEQSKFTFSIKIKKYMDLSYTKRNLKNMLPSLYHCIEATSINPILTEILYLWGVGEGGAESRNLCNAIHKEPPVFFSLPYLHFVSKGNLTFLEKK